MGPKLLEKRGKHNAVGISLSIIFGVRCTTRVGRVPSLEACILHYNASHYNSHGRREPKPVGMHYNEGAVRIVMDCIEGSLQSDVIMHHIIMAPEGENPNRQGYITIRAPYTL